MPTKNSISGQTCFLLKGFTIDEIKTILLKMRIFQLGLSMMAANSLLPKEYNMQDMMEILSSTANWINFSSFNLKSFILAFCSTLLINFIINIFEETAWRGYLTSQPLKLPFPKITRISNFLQYNQLSFERVHNNSSLSPFPTRILYHK